MRMTRTDPRVDAYIAKGKPFAKPILRHLRELVHGACPEAEETLKWRSPTFTYRGKILCGMAAFQEHCTFGFWHQGMTAVLGADARTGTAGLLGRLTSVEDLPSRKKMVRYVREAVRLNESGTPALARSTSTKRAAAPLPVPADLAAALKKNKAAAAMFDSMSPGRRKDYIEWITEAKRDETRQKRLATAVEWIAEGKSRNWKCENC